MTRTDGSNVVVDAPLREQGISRREGDQPIQKSEYTKNEGEETSEGTSQLIDERGSVVRVHGGIIRSGIQDNEGVMVLGNGDKGRGWKEDMQI